MQIRTLTATPVRQVFQVDALCRWRATEKANEALRESLFVSVSNGFHAKPPRRKGFFGEEVSRVLNSEKPEGLLASSPKLALVRNLG